MGDDEDDGFWGGGMVRVRSTYLSKLFAPFHGNSAFGMMVAAAASITTVLTVVLVLAAAVSVVLEVCADFRWVSRTNATRSKDLQGLGSRMSCHQRIFFIPYMHLYSFIPAIYLPHLVIDITTASINRAIGVVQQSR